VSTGLDRYKEELAKLVSLGYELQNAMGYKIDPEAVKKQIGKENLQAFY
jgi:hypothetical protein